MSLPPSTLQIKRKRTDEPVEFLRIQELNGKRQRTIDGYIFERQAPPTPTFPSVSQETLIGARPIKPLHRSGSSQILAAQAAQSHEAATQAMKLQAHMARDEAVDKRAQQGESILLVHKQPQDHSTSHSGSLKNQQNQVRRFHISRGPAGQEADNTGQHRKRKEIPIVFVERRLRTRAPGLSSTTEKSASIPPIELSPVKPQKRPGKNARTPVAQSTKTIKYTPVLERKADVPSALRNRWDITSDQLAKEMEAYTLQEIGFKLAEQEAANPRPKDTRSGQGLSKFKPKVPALRYAERHPEGLALESLDTDMEYEVAEEETDGEEFITETYIRVPVDVFQATYANVGFLILDSQPDIKEFYGEDEESDEDDEYEDEDENAENHYSADYPDEEVDSDDEYGRNAYTYRNNASDDEFDATYSDSEDDEAMARTHPWRHQPGGLR